MSRLKVYTLVMSALLTLFLGNSTRAQDIKGVVKASTGYLDGVVITNCTTKVLAFSSKSGEFQINAVKGDTLTFHLFNYAPDTVVISDQKLLIITLKNALFVLNEVFIKGTKLSPLDQYLKNQEDYKEIYRTGNMKNLFSINGSSGGAGLGLSIDAIYSALSVQGRNARRLQKTLTTDYHSNVVDNRFTTALVAKITGYQGKQLNDFIINNRPSYDFIATASDYDIIQYIKRRVDGVVMQSDNPLPAKVKSSGLHIKYVPAAKTYDNSVQGARYIPIHP